MGLEAGNGYISGLVATNPVGATDPKSQGDDHIRLIKVALLGTFPGLTGAVTASQAELNILDGATLSTAELNYVDGVTSAIQTQLDAKLASASYTAADVLSKLLTVDGAGSGLDADLLDGLSSAAFAVLASAGTANKFTSANPIRLANDSATLDFYNTANDARSGFVQMLTTGWNIGTELNQSGALLTNGTNRLVINGSGDFDFKGGTVTTNNASAAEVGFKGLPSATDETPVLADAGKLILASGNVTIPANASIAYPIGTVIIVVNNTGSTITVAVTSDTLRWSGTGGTDGTRTIASHQGVATLIKLSSTLWVISGDIS